MKNINKRKNIIIITGIILLIVIVGGATYAWVTYTTGNIMIGGNTRCFNINFVKGKDITGNIAPIDTSKYVTNNTIILSTTMGFAPVSFELEGKCSSFTGTGTIKLNVSSISSAYTSEGNSYGALKYVVAEYNPNLYNDSTINSLANVLFNYTSSGTISSTGTFNIHTVSLSPGVKNNFLVILYIDSSSAGNDISGATITASISATANQVVE